MCFASVSQEPGSALIQTGEAGSLVSPGKFGCQCWLPERLYRGYGCIISCRTGLSRCHDGMDNVYGLPGRSSRVHVCIGLKFDFH